MFAKTKWAAGLAMAVMVFNGSAMLDGQKVEGEPAPAEPVWHNVRSVMDIDNLPKGAEYVRAEGQSCSLLDFLVEVKALKGINLSGGHGLRSEHIAALKNLPSLMQLDLRGVTWAEEPNYKPFLELKGLKSVGLDPTASYRIDSDEDSLDIGSVMIELKALEANGVELSLGWLTADDEILSDLLVGLGGVRGLQLKAASDHHLKMVTGFKKLRELALLSPSADEIGFAYLARGTNLQSLRVWNKDFAPELLHHVGRMQALTELQLDGAIKGDARKTLGQLAGLKNLRRLELRGMEIDAGEGEHWKPVLNALPAVDTICFDADEGFNIRETAFSELPSLKARRAELNVHYGGALAFDPMSIAGTNDRLEVLQLQFEYTELPENAGTGGLANVLERCPKLRRIEVVFPEENATSEVRAFVKWIQGAAGDIEVVEVR